MNVREYGAVGDGEADDSQAIIAATAALKPGHTLFFPTGSYRFAQPRPALRAAIVISGTSDVAVEFGRDAELLMDNLDGGVGTSHGILVRGKASGVTLRNVRVRWKTQPARRSFGDGVRIVGFPADDGAPPPEWTGSTGQVTDVRILDCEVRSSPQAGVIMMGVSGIRVDGLKVHDTMADGLHFNACREATVHGHRAVNTGDDGLALVTYYSESFAYDNVAQTFSLPELSDWSNSDFAVTDVAISGGKANGVRVAGAHHVRIGRLLVSGKRLGAGVILDSAAPGVKADWHYLAARGVRLNRLRIEDCEMGVQLLARPNATSDRRFTEFGLEVDNTQIIGCSNWSMRAESLTAQRATGLTVGVCRIESTSTSGGNGGVGLQNLDAAHLDTLTVSHAEPVTVFSVVDSADLDVDRLLVTVADSVERVAPAPCAVFRASGGRIGSLTVKWPAAPAGWQPVRFDRADGRCVDMAAVGALAVTSLTLEPPSLKETIGRC